MFISSLDGALDGSNTSYPVANSRRMFISSLDGALYKGRSQWLCLTNSRWSPLNVEANAFKGLRAAKAQSDFTLRA